MKIQRRSEIPGAGPGARADELEALLGAARAATDLAEPASALDRILEAAMGAVGAHQGSVMLLDEASKTLRVTASYGLPPAARAERVALGQGIAGTVAATGEPALLRSAVDIDRFAGHAARERSIFGSLCVPMRSGSERLGVLNLTITQPGVVFSEHHLRLVSLFAETATQTIVNARLSERTRRHAIEMEILSGAMVRLGASLDLATVAETALQEALTLASSDAAFIAVSSDPDRAPDLVRFAGLTRASMQQILSRPAFRALDLPDDTLIVADVAADPAFAPIAPELGARRLALIPLRASDGSARGLLAVALGPEGSGASTRTLSTYGIQAGLALSNAGLHRAVSESEHELDTIVRTLDLPILLLDEEGRFRAINPAAAALLHLSPDFELGRSARGKLDPALEGILLGTGESSAAFEIIDQGRMRRIHVTASDVTEGSGAGTRIVIVTDVTASTELERRKADFLAVIGHELRTPLTSIKGFARTMAKHGEAMDPTMRRKAVETIVTQSERLERLIEDLLYMARIEDKDPPLHLTWEDIREVCVQIVAEASRRRPDRVIRFDHPGDGIAIFTDRVKVEQILWHVVDNALKFSGQDTMVAVELAQDDTTVTIAVRDEGCGIYSGDLERIFEPFTQIDGSSTRAHGGTGVGLHVARTLAHALGGTIEVDSVLGRGSTFTIGVPRSTVDPQA